MFLMLNMDTFTEPDTLGEESRIETGRSCAELRLGYNSVRLSGR